MSTDSSVVRASGICLEGPGFNPQSGHLFCLTERSTGTGQDGEVDDNKDPGDNDLV